MALEVKRLDGIEQANQNQWNNVVEQSDLGCVYHRYEWLRAIETGIGHNPKHLVVSKKDNPIAIFPNFVTDLGPLKRLSSIRPGYGGPIAMTEEEDALDLLLDTVSECCNGSVVLNELRTYDQSFVRYQTAFREAGYRPEILSCRFTLDLTNGWEAIFDGMHSERRRGIRRGHDQAFEVVDEEVTEGTLSAFYDDYATVMDRVEQPTLPWSFVRQLNGFSDRVKLFTLRVDGEQRGSYLYLLDEEQSTVQHTFTGVMEEHFEYHAAELLHEHAINWGIDQGYETYELRGSPADFRNGVFRFKEYFGAQPTPVLSWERGRPAPLLSMLNTGRTIAQRFGR